MVKRKSNGSEPAAAQPKATKKGSTPSLPADALQLPHIRLFDQWAYLTRTSNRDFGNMFIQSSLMISTGYSLVS